VHLPVTSGLPTANCNCCRPDNQTYQSHDIKVIDGNNFCKLNEPESILASASIYPSGGQDPKINAGSPTYPLDIAIALTDERKALMIALINPTEATQRLT
jgi:hypothetical protein